VHGQQDVCDRGTLPRATAFSGSVVWQRRLVLVITAAVALLGSGSAGALSRTALAANAPARQAARDATSPVGAATPSLQIGASTRALEVSAGTSTPRANTGAFNGHGELAFISSDNLWALDGAQGTLRELPVPGGFEPSSPMFSYDGRWLAYLATNSTNSSYGAELWLAWGDGTAAHRVSDVAVGDIADLVGWSPTGDLLAVVAQSGHQTNAVWIVSPDGTSRRIFALGTASLRSASIEDVAWSPDGRAIAVSTVDYAPGKGAAVRSYPVGGGQPRTWFSIKNTQTLPGICNGCGGGGVIADLAGWWPGWGIGFWVFSSGMTHNNDDTPLEVLSAPGATPHIIGGTLSDGETTAVAAAPQGALAIVNSTGGRELGAGKQVETCDATSRTCIAVPGASTWSGPDAQSCDKPCFPHPAPGRPGSGVSLDPAWSPNGKVLAYVKAPVALTGGWPSLAWYEAHDLMVWDSQARTSRRLAAVSGASVPSWSRDGKYILFVKDDGLWLVAFAGGTPVEVASPLYSPAEWRSAYAPNVNLGSVATIAYYGQVPWTSQFAWWSPP